MKNYIHKVKMAPMDGWGRDLGMDTVVLGIYANKEKAVEEKNKRDNSEEATPCDVGNSWIEEIEIQ